MMWCGSCLLFQLTLKDISGAHIIVVDKVLECILPMKKRQCVIHFTVLFVNIELILLKNRKFCLLSALFVTRENLLPSSSSSGLFNS